MEYGVKIRFIILFFGPNKPNVDYGEIGRCVGALMNNQVLYYFFSFLFMIYLYL